MPWSFGAANGSSSSWNISRSKATSVGGLFQPPPCRATLIGPKEPAPTRGKAEAGEGSDYAGVDATVPEPADPKTVPGTVAGEKETAPTRGSWGHLGGASVHLAQFTKIHQMKPKYAHLCT
jgi:hypothetical protein